MAFPDELRSALPSLGPDWDRAVAAGIDVSLLLENLSLTPEARLERLEALLRELDALKESVRTHGSVP